MLSWCIRAITRISICQASVASPLTKPLGPDYDMMFAESRARVITMLDGLEQHDPSASDKVGHNSAIAEAFPVVDGEPMTEVSDDVVAERFYLRSCGAIA